MTRLTISVTSCTEILAALVAFAWADGKLAEEEKEGVRGAAHVLNLTKESRARLEQMLEKPAALADAKLDGLSRRDKAFAYVAAAWMAHLDAHVDLKEEAMLGDLAKRLGVGDKERAELDALAKGLEGAGKVKNKFRWAEDVTAMFKAIPARLEHLDEADVEVVFE